ncbi:NAD(P)/FAD-dependent oxidoreductase [Clostridium cadaveris]|uniref:NAD(P)/FAD-dependent oxidoreductase n=1 Tax=Clostridium cadaveris TaxID=1529 RepID=UPI0015B61C24|nr:NAD(P)/FAD-dependent oxidoreductase [Clostridium cadaveris]NWK10142.1 NAD(P)/FAD-dependent oxidoreductase [Clostridium cadaveris]UFH64916.1 NAD(P)/FAD-dependent oxidoreductase [Clostridium cadaveris]
MNHHDVIIIGGGASGVMCAIACKDFGLDVVLLEGTDRICKKVLTTGNGRCNITNSSIKEPFLSYHSKNNDFFTDTLKNFSVNDTINFFSILGLPLIELENGKMYPRSLQASSVIDIFRMALDDREIPLYLNHKVNSIIKTKKGFTLSIKNSEDTFSCKKLILCTGGKSAANTGSDGSGYTLAKTLGHNIINPLPGIVQLKLNYPHLKALSGVKFNGWVDLFINDKLIRREFGEILFTDYGISGPPILQISSNASIALSMKKKVQIKIDMLPDMDEDTLINFLEGHFGMFGHRSVTESFIGIINKKLIPTILKEAHISSLHKPCYELEWEEKSNIYNLLKSWAFEVSDTNSFSNAQVTVGGVDTSEVNSNSLESKLCKNLFFCGEVLDVNGDCGGFNLQWAWSSALAAAKAVKNDITNNK